MVRSLVNFEFEDFRNQDNHILLVQDSEKNLGWFVKF